jgi:hypothetical protein
MRRTYDHHPHMFGNSYDLCLQRDPGESLGWLSIQFKPHSDRPTEMSFAVEVSLRRGNIGVLEDFGEVLDFLREYDPPDRQLTPDQFVAFIEGIGYEMWTYEEWYGLTDPTDDLDDPGGEWGGL